MHFGLRAVHILCHPSRGREGVSQMLTLADMGGRGGQGKNDRMTQHGGRGGGGEQSGNNFDPKCSSGVPKECSK